MVKENLKFAGKGGSTVYVRINNWETLMTMMTLKAIVYEDFLAFVWLRLVVRIMSNDLIGNLRNWSVEEG